MMPSFDVVSEFDMQELSNAVDQAGREVATRFDFKGTNSRFELSGAVVGLHSESDFQLKQMLDILRAKLVKRGIDLACLQVEEPVLTGKQAYQTVTLRHGINSDLGRSIIKKIKEKKLKVQTSIQGDQVRVSGKKRDDLQSVIQLLKESDIELPLQYRNFRD